MVLHNLLWSAALPELPRGKGPGIACVAHASNHGSPRNPLSLFPHSKKILRRVQHHWQVAREVSSSDCLDVRIFSSPGSGTPPRHPSDWKEEVGQVEGAEGPGLVAMASQSHSRCWSRVLRWSLRHRGLRPAHAHRCCFCSTRRAGGLASRLRILQVDSVSLDLIDSHLDEQDVGDDAVVSLLRHELRRGSCHFVVA